MGVAVLKKSIPAIQQPWRECVNSAVSFCFDIQDGFTGCVRVLRIPPGVCLTFEEYCWPCNCGGKPEYLAVQCPGCNCGSCEMCIDCVDEVELPPGRYHMLAKDAEGNPFIPGESEILVKVTHKC